MTKHPDRIDLVLSEAARIEAIAVEAGHGPLNEETKRTLGNLSVATLAIEERGNEVKKNIAHLEQIRAIAALFPRRNEEEVPGFDLDSEDLNTQYMARKIQAHTLWIDTQEALWPYEFIGRPYYIIGRKDSDTENVTALLLASPSSRNGKITKLMVNRNDMLIRDHLISRIESKEFSEEDARHCIDNSSGYFIVQKNTQGSISAGLDKNARSTESRVTKSGVRIIGFKDRYPAYPPHEEVKQISAEEIESFNVHTKLATMASAFGVNDKLEALLGAEVTQISPVTKEQLIEQNTELRLALRGMMVGTGLFSESEVDAHLEKKFPTLSQ